MQVKGEERGMGKGNGVQEGGWNGERKRKGKGNSGQTGMWEGKKVGEKEYRGEEGMGTKRGEGKGNIEG